MKRQGLESIQYTIRGIPKEVDRVLRKKAAQRKQSLNRFIIEELGAAAGVQKKADFSDLVGQWSSDPDFDRIVESQRQIDLDEWK